MPDVWAGPAGPHDTEGRWAAARRLLRDDTIATPDRVAGLLLLLYAQRLATISTLTVEHITTANRQVALRLGSAATILPPNRWPPSSSTWSPPAAPSP